MQFLVVGGTWYCYDPAAPPLGAGTTGEVYLGFRCGDEERVAIKRIRPEFAANAIMRKYLEKEASVVFEHPNIVRTLGVCELQDGSLFILSEYVAGTTLSDYIKNVLPMLSQDERITKLLDIFRQILAALKHMHSLQWAHLDIKPSNVMIDCKSQVKLMDMGISVFYGYGSNAGREFVGTPAYAAPEQIPNAMPGYRVDNRSDIYSFGMSLYEALSGSSPVAGMSDTEALHFQRYGKLENTGDIPDVLFRIIRKATDKFPDRRYSSVEELDDDLERYQTKKEKTSATTLTIVLAAVTILTFIIIFCLWNL